MKGLRVLMSVGFMLFSVVALGQEVAPAPVSTKPQLPDEKVLSKCSAEGVAFQNNQVIFNADKPTPRIFLIQNTSGGKVLLNHMKADPGAGAGWASSIDKGKWSALVMAQSNFSMGCMLYSPPKFGLIDCKNVVSVCSIPTSVASSGFWVAENDSLEKIVATAQSRGINM